MRELIPLPVTAEKSRRDETRWIVRSADGRWLCDFAGPAAQRLAELITGALNSHRDLLQALQQLADAVEAEVDQIDHRGDRGNLLARLSDARSAIAQATAPISSVRPRAGGDPAQTVSAASGSSACADDEREKAGARPCLTC